MAGRLRVATAGVGYFSRFHYEAWRRMDDVDIVALCNRTEDTGRAMAEEHGIGQVFTDFQTMLDSVEIDLVDIITPPPTHRPYIEQAAARNIAAICQKPFCETLGDAEAAVAAAEKAGTALVVHENFRFQPWHAEARRLIAEGRLGTLYQVTFRLRPGDGQGADAYLDRQPYFRTMGRFLVHETAIHLIDTFRYLMGEVETVYAQLDRLNPAIAGEDAGIIVFAFEGGARGVFDGNRLADHAAENRRLTMGEMLIEGSDATLRLDGDGGLFLRRHGRNDEERISYDWRDVGFGGDCVYRLQRHVVDNLLGRGPLVNTGAEYLTNLRIEQAVYESGRSGQRLSL